MDVVYSSETTVHCHHRRRRRIAATLCGLLGGAPSASSAFGTARWSSGQGPPSSMRSVTSTTGPLEASSSSSAPCRAAAPSTTATKVELESMTVKELRQLIKDWGLHERGLNSRLKLKRDVVDFLVASQQRGATTNGASASAAATAPKEVALEPPPRLAQRPPESVASSLSSSPAATKRPKTAMKRGVKMPRMSTMAKQLALDDTINGSTPADASEGSVGDRDTVAAGAAMAPHEDNVIDGDVYVNSAAPATPRHLNRKEHLFASVIERYPPLRDALQNAGVDPADYDGSQEYDVPSDVGELDVRHSHHPVLANSVASDMDVVFVGTASCVPSLTRGVSCTALRLNWRRRTLSATTTRRGKGRAGGIEEIREDFSAFTGGTWLFDCGESTQLQVQRTGSVKPGKITKIFITHAHGDHSFGLPGLLCLMGQNRDRDAPPVEIYGPEGLRMWLRVAIRYSVSRIVPPYRVHELMDVPMAPEWDEGHWKNGRYYYQLSKEGGKGGAWGMKGLAGDDPLSWISRAPMLNLERSNFFGEIDGGRDIYPVYNHPQCRDGAPLWEVEDEGDVSVNAAPMSHGVPCLGYVVEEQARPGRLRSDLVEPIAKRNVKALKEAGMRVPMKVMALIKNLPEGGSYTFPDGTVVHQSDVVEPARKGRKVVICGDTADARAIEGLAQGADLLIHEATNTFLRGIDSTTDLHVVTKDAKIHGHSTPYMAGDFALRIGAKKLILNHFSSRYKGDQSIDSLSIMTRMERQAIKASGLPDNAVACAWDMMIMPIPIS